MFTRATVGKFDFSQKELSLIDAKSKSELLQEDGGERWFLKLDPLYESKD